MSPETRRGRPRQGALTEIAHPSLVPVTDPLDDIAHHVDGAFVLVVRINGGLYRRRCFLTAKSAERAARNATDAGHTAEVFLAELKPLWRLAGPGAAS